MKRDQDSRPSTDATSSARLASANGFVEPSPADGMKRTLIVGAGSGGRMIATELRTHPQWRLKPVGFVDDNRRKLGRKVCGVQVLGDTAAIPVIVEQEAIDVVVLAIPSASQATLDDLARLAKSTGAEVVTMPSLGAILSGQHRPTTLQRIQLRDLLGRPAVEHNLDNCRAFIRARRVLITGAAGSIGRELASQVALLRPAVLHVVDINESDLHDLWQDLRLRVPDIAVVPVVASVTDAALVGAVMRDLRPDVVFHAAAYKHVPLMERYPAEAVRTNVLGTRNVAIAAAESGVERFVLVSTDKAVRPSSVMGATKRLAEIVLADIAYRTELSECSVRFGNVLGSRGSVIPTFERQIRAGGPVTVTDPRMRRYFMTIEEAASLIIQAGAGGQRNVICMLDMGEDVSILKLAERVIRMHGLRPYVDVAIEFTGVRPGEKLREDLANDFEAAQPSWHPKIRTLQGSTGASVISDLDSHLRELAALGDLGATDQLKAKLHELVERVDHHEAHQLARARERARDADPAVPAFNQ